MDTSRLAELPQNIFGKLTETVAIIPLPQGLVFAPNWIHAGAIVLLLFLMIVMFGRMRHLYVGWSIKGVLPGVLFGFCFALILEAFFILAGRTVVTEFIGWQNPPKPVSVALEFGRERLANTLGASTVIPQSSASGPNLQSLINEVGKLSPTERSEFESYVCKPTR